LGSVDESQQLCAVVGAVYGHPAPITALPQICEEAGAIFVKTQKSLALDIEYPGTPLDESSPGPQALQQIAESVQCTCASVFHCPMPRSISSLDLACIQNCSVAPVSV
jgi:hypothetical protein